MEYENMPVSKERGKKDILQSHYDKGVRFGYLEVCRKINDLIEQGALNVREPFGPLDPEMFLQVGSLSIVDDTITLQYEGNATYEGVRMSKVKREALLDSAVSEIEYSIKTRHTKSEEASEHYLRNAVRYIEEAREVAE